MGSSPVFKTLCTADCREEIEEDVGFNASAE